MKLLLDEIELRKLCLSGRRNDDNKILWKHLKIPEPSEQTSLPPYRFIYCKVPFDEGCGGVRADVAYLYKQYELRSNKFSSRETEFMVSSPMLANRNDLNGSVGRINGGSSAFTFPPMTSMLREVDRLKLIHSIISSKAPGCCNIDIYRLLKSKCILAYFPLHDADKVKKLEKKWVHFFQAPWKQEVGLAKDYFGEKIGLYFVWLGYYTTLLIIPSIFGVITWVLILSDSDNPNASVVPYFAAFMAIWSSLFLEFWKRKEKYTAMEWGMTGFEQNEQVRPQFKGQISRSPVDGKPCLYHSRFDRFKKSFRSNTAVCGFVLVVLCTIAVIFVIRVALYPVRASINGDNISIVASSILLAIQIQACNSVYAQYAIDLNDQENHRTGKLIPTDHPLLNV
jgi:hypothetical protein